MPRPAPRSPRLRALALALTLAACGGRDPVQDYEPLGDGSSQQFGDGSPADDSAVTDDGGTSPFDDAVGPTDDLSSPLDDVTSPLDDAGTVTPFDSPTPPPPVDSGGVTPPPPVDSGAVTPPPPPVDSGVPSTFGMVPSCITVREGSEGGGTCSGVDRAYTARGINVGYYPFRVLRPIQQYSGDFSGNLSRVFEAGGPFRGVLLQTIPAGSYVAFSSTGLNYNPPTGCEAETTCGRPDRAACGNNSPPMRPGIIGFFWGYAYQGASHMQGWIPFVPESLQYAGDDPNHPCALGPAGADYEVHSACGRATRCRGNNPTCGASNHCDEGGDDCGRTACGARAGGSLTPSAWRRTVAAPSGTHSCVRTPPHPSVRCFANGNERDFFFVYPFGAYLYWAQNSTTRNWLHYGDRVQVYFHNRDAQGVLWDFVEVLSSGSPILTPASDGSGGGSSCTDTRPENCHPCRNGGTCGWVQDVFLR